MGEGLGAHVPGVVEGHGGCGYVRGCRLGVGPPNIKLLGAIVPTSADLQ